MTYDIKEVSSRLKQTREYLDVTAETMAEKTDTPLNEYIALENGEADFSLSFLNGCANVLGLELIELLTGTTPTLKKYSVVKNGKGLAVEQRRAGFSYSHLAYLFKNKKIEPLMVTAPYESGSGDIHMNSHEGQEMDLIISGRLRFVIDGHEEILDEGDCVYYDGKTPHGMAAAGGRECKFLAVLI